MDSLVLQVGWLHTPRATVGQTSSTKIFIVKLKNISTLKIFRYLRSQSANQAMWQLQLKGLEMRLRLVKLWIIRNYCKTFPCMEANYPLCHKEPARSKQNTPSRGIMRRAGSLWPKAAGSTNESGPV